MAEADETERSRSIRLVSALTDAWGRRRFSEFRNEARRRHRFGQRLGNL